MREKRSLFQKIFGKKTPPHDGDYQVCKLLNSWQTRFTPFSGNAYSESIVRTAVHTFAKRAACVKPRHVKYDDKEKCYKEIPHSAIYKLFTRRPNGLTTPYKLFYRAATQYKLYNNAFLYPVYEFNKFTERNELTAIYNITATAVEIVEYEGEIFCLFEFGMTGDRYIVPYSDVVHIGTHFNNNDVWGEGNEPINGTLRLEHGLKQNIEKYAELIQVLRGLLIVHNSTTKDSDLKAQRDKFIKNNLTMDEDTGGIIVTDGKLEYKPIETKESPIPITQLNFVKNEIYGYFGVNEAIVTNSATPDQENAFYNGELAPFYEQLEQALTGVLCRDGSEIICTSSLLRNASVADKTSVISFLSSLGGITTDEARDQYGLPPLGGEAGRRLLQSLNYVSTAKADEYQTGDKTPPAKE